MAQPTKKAPDQVLIRGSLGQDDRPTRGGCGGCGGPNTLNAIISAGLWLFWFFVYRDKAVSQMRFAPPTPPLFFQTQH